MANEAADDKNAAPALLAGRYFVHSGQPLGELATPTAQAFAADDKKDSSRVLFALICNPQLPPRVGVMRSLKGAQSPGLMQMVEWGTMFWPPMGRQVMTIIYERPVVARVMASLNDEIRRIDDISFAQRLVAPLIAAIRELTARGVTHRAIRPTNMYYTDADKEQIVFGDCATSPPGFDQPLIFETIESGMAHPAGRGSGNYGNDLYSLGVTILFLALGRNPVGHMSDADVLKAKIQQGSYSALVGDARLPLPVTEILRGLLCDDPDQRWNLESLDMWLAGRRLSPLLTKMEKRGARAFPFNGKEYWNCRELAAAFSRHWDKAISVVRDGQVEIWLKRAISDKELAEHVAGVVANATAGEGAERTTTDMMMTKVCMLLDPAAPIRYKGLHVMPDGLGALLASLYLQDGDVNLFSELVLREIPKMWYESQPKYNPDHTIWGQINKQLRLYLQQRGLGYGMERVLYETNEVLPCQSPLLGEEYVVEIRQLLPALNAAAKKGDQKGWPIDRHIAAFISARFGHDVDKYIAQLNDQNKEKANLAMLNLLAVVQYRLGPESLPNLAGWVGGLMQPCINSFHSRDQRQHLEKEIPKVVRKGSLVELYQLVDDAESRQKDNDGFGWAIADYAAAEREIGIHELTVEQRNERGLRVGQQLASTLSVLIALVTVTILVLMRVF